MLKLSNRAGRDRVGRFGRSPFYLSTLSMLAAIAVASFLMLPDTRTASAKADDGKADVRADGKQELTQAMLDYALNLKTASEYTVYAERGVSQKGSSIKGEIGDVRRDAAGRKATKELSNSIDAIRQLPCTDLKSSNLSGRTFGPGVYCLKSAELAGEITLDGGGNAAGTFVFRVEGSLKVKGGSNIRLENSAQAGNVFFVSDTASIASDVNFRSNILTTKSANISGTVTGKVLSLGEVSMDMAHVAGGGTGTMEICKEEIGDDFGRNDESEGRPDGVLPPNLANHIFQFTVTGAINQGTAANPVQVAVGQCSAPFDVAIGPQTVTELNNGTLISPAGTPWAGNFELVDVRNLTPGSTSSLGLVNLALRTAQVNIVQGDTATQLTLEFTNRPTITGFVEICKQAARGPDGFNPASPPAPFGGGDPDVTGYFNFTVEGVYTSNTLNPTQKVYQIFSIPVGECTGPIAVTRGIFLINAPLPRRAVIAITELGRAGSYLESVNIAPASRQWSPLIYASGINENGIAYPNPGGGYVFVTMPESATSANETLVTFVNRSNPGMVKVCKIAGPGIPLNTLFQFTVIGNYGATQALPPQTTTYGIVARTFDVRAGDPAQGGQCVIVPGLGAGNGYAEFQTFINGTPVNVVENGISPNNTIPQNPGTLQTSRIRTSSVFTPAGLGGYVPNPDLSPGSFLPRPAGSGNPTTNVIGGPVCNVPADYATIQLAVNDAGCTTINVAAGTYAEAVSIPAARTNLVINGPNASATACGARAPEAVVGNTTGGFYVAANGVKISGFTVQGNTNGAFFGGGILVGANTSGVQILNNIVQNNIIGILLGGDDSTIQGNLIRNNNNPGPASGSGIYTDQFVAGGTLSNVLIDNNCFSGNDDAALGFSSTDSAAPATVIVISNNEFTGNGRAFYMFSVTNSSFVTNRSSGATLLGSGDLRIFEGVNGLTINSNCLSDGLAAAVRISDAGTGLPPATGVSMGLNSITNYGGNGIEIVAGGYTGGLNAENNYWGSTTGPTIASNPPGTGETIVDPATQIDYQPFLPFDSATPCATPIDFTSRATVIARAGVVEVEFVNYRFNPAQLKVCKIAGAGVPVDGTANYTFDVTFVSPVSQPGNVPLFPGNLTTQVTVTANDPPGNCSFAYGPFAGGTYNQGSMVTVTEQTGNPTSITSTSAGPGGFSVDLANKRGTFNGPNGIVAGINAVTFTNIGATPYVGAARYDYDGDHKADPSIFTPSSAKWTWAASAEGLLIRTNNFGIATDKVVPADYDGDGKTDIAVYRPETGMWYFLGSTQVFQAHQWGQPGDIPQTGDYDGDGKADFVVFRPSDGTWYEKRSRDGFNFVEFGRSGDRPLAADYDGDGKTDLGVLRPENHTWYTLGSTLGFRAAQFGQTGDVPVPADYDGDGAADIAVYRGGMWYILTRTAFLSYQYGIATDTPVPDDYDGDGVTNLAVYRGPEGIWFISTVELAIPNVFTLGTTGDTIIPGAY